MAKSTIAVLAIAASAGVPLAAGTNAFKERRALMKANGEASKPIVPMQKSAATFDWRRCSRR
jgi:hypothetical protein